MKRYKQISRMFLTPNLINLYGTESTSEEENKNSKNPSFRERLRWHSITGTQFICQLRERRPLITFSKPLDICLDGGLFSSSGIYAVCGPPGVGKTQFCMQLALNVQIPKQFWGMEKNVWYIDTEGGLTVSRYNAMARGLYEHIRLLQKKNFSDTFKKPQVDVTLQRFMEGILVTRIFDIKELYHIVSHLDEILQNNTFPYHFSNLGLIIIDSLSFPLRTSFKEENDLHRVLGFKYFGLQLERISLYYNLVVVITNQVTLRTKMLNENESIEKKSWFINENLTPCFVSSMKSISRTILFMDFTKTPQHIAVRMSSRYDSENGDPVVIQVRDFLSTVFKLQQDRYLNVLKSRQVVTIINVEGGIQTCYALMSHLPKLPAKTRKRFSTWCENLACTELPSIQYDALVDLDSWMTQSEKHIEPYEIILARQICFSLAGLDVEEQNFLAKERFFTKPLPVMESLAPQCLTLALKLYMLFDDTQAKTVRSFLEWLCATIKCLKERDGKVLCYSVVTWFAEKCVNEAFSDATFISSKDRLADNVQSFTFYDAVSAMLPFTLRNKEIFTRHCFVFVSTVLYKSRQIQNSTLPLICLGVVFENLWSASVSFLPSNALLLSRLVTLYLTAISEISLTFVNSASEFLKGFLSCVAQIQLFHTHPLNFLTSATLPSSTCSACDSLHTVISQVVTFLLHANALNSSNLCSSRENFYPILYILTQEIENALDRHDFETVRYSIKVLTDVLPFFFNAFSCSNSPTLLYWLLNSAYLVSFILWGHQHMTQAFLLECLQYIEFLLRFLETSLTQDDSNYNLQLGSVEIMSLVSAVSFALLHIFYNSRYVDSFEDIEQRLSNIILKLQQNVLSICNSFKEPLCYSLSRSFFVVNSLGSVLRFKSVSVLAMFLCGQCDQKILANILQRSFHNISMKRDLQLVLFIVGIFLHFGLTFEGAVYLPENLIKKFQLQDFEACYYCTPRDPVLGFLCYLKQMCLLWLFDFLGHWNVFKSCNYLPLLLKIATGTTISSGPRSLALCPQIRCKAMMVIVGIGREKVLVPAVYRALSTIASPFQLSNVDHNIPTPILFSLCATLMAFGELHAAGELGLSKISNFLVYDNEAPFLLRLTRLHILNLMAEEQPSDAVKSLVNIQTGLKDSHHLIRNSALMCLCRLCCQDVMDFSKVWTILNGKHYSKTILDPLALTVSSIKCLSRFLREYIVRKVIPGVMETVETFTEAMLSVKPLVAPLSLLTAANVMDLLIRLTESQFALLKSDSVDVDVIEAESNLATCVDLCGRLGEQLYLAFRTCRTWESVLVFSNEASLFIQRSIQIFSDSQDFSLPSLQHFWKSILSSTTPLELSSPSLILQFVLSVCFKWNQYYQERTLISTNNSITLGVFDSLHDGTSRCCYFLLRPFFSDLGRCRLDCEEKSLSFSLLFKAIKPFAHGSRSHCLSPSAQSLFQLTTGLIYSMPSKRTETLAGYDVFMLVKEIIVYLPQLMTSSHIYCSLVPLFWKNIFTRLLLHPSFQAYDTICPTTSEGVSSISTINIFVLSLLNLLHWSASDMEKLNALRPGSIALYTDEDVNQLFTVSGFCEAYLNTLYAVVVLCCRSDVSIHIVHFVLEFLSCLLINLEGVHPSEEINETASCDVYELSPQFHISCVSMLMILYRHRLCYKPFEKMCLGCIQRFLPHHQVLVEKCAQFLNISSEPLRMSSKTIALLSGSLTSFAEYYWEVTPLLLQLQLAILTQLWEDFKANSCEDSYSVKFSDLEIAVQGMVEMIHFIDTVNTTYENLKTLEEQLTVSFYSLFSSCHGVRNIIFLFLIAEAHKVLIKHHHLEEFSESFVSALKNVCHYLEDPRTFPIPYMSLAMCSVTLGDLLDLSSRFDIKKQTLREAKLSVQCFQRLTQMSIALPQNLYPKETSFYSTFRLEEYWAKRLAILILNDISLSYFPKSVTSQIPDPTFQSKFATPNELKQLLEALHLSHENRNSTNHQFWHPGHEQIFNKTFDSSQNPILVYQNILIVGLLLQHLSVSQHNSKISLESLGLGHFPSNNPIVLVAELMMHLSQKLNLCISANETFSMKYFFEIFASILSTLWSVFSFTSDLPGLNTAPCAAASLQFTTKRLIMLESFKKTQAESKDLNVIYKMQSSLIKACLSLGRHEPRHNMILCNFIFSVFQRVSATDLHCRQHVLFSNRYFRYIYFRIWNALMSLFFRLPLSQFKTLFHLAFLSLPHPAHDTILWVFVLQQLVHLFGLLYVSVSSSGPSHHSNLLIPTCCTTTLLNVVSDSHYRKNLNPEYNLKPLISDFLIQIFAPFFSKELPNHLFDPESLKTTFPRFHSDISCQVITSFGELFAAYYQLFTESADFSNTSHPKLLHDLNVPIVAYAFLIVQVVDFPTSLLNNVRDKILSSSLSEELNCQDLALCIAHLSEKLQRQYILGLLQCCTLSPEKRVKVGKILKYFFLEMRFPFSLFNTSVSFPKKYEEDQQQQQQQQEKKDVSICFSGSTELIMSQKSTPVVSSRELFVTENGIAYLSQLSSHVLFKQPITLYSAERITVQHMENGKRSRLKWTFPPTVVYPIPACFSSSLHEALDALSIRVENLKRLDDDETAEPFIFDAIQFSLEAWLNYMYLYSLKHPPFIESYHLEFCLKKRNLFYSRRCRYRAYFFEKPSAALKNCCLNFHIQQKQNVSSAFLHGLGQKILSRLFDRQPNKANILTLFSSSLQHPEGSVEEI